MNKKPLEVISWPVGMMYAPISPIILFIVLASLPKLGGFLKGLIIISLLYLTYLSSLFLRAMTIKKKEDIK